MKRRVRQDQTGTNMNHLICQAVGASKAEENGWEALHHPETDLLPAIAARLGDGLGSPKAQGLKRYTWIRHRLLLEHAQRVASLDHEALLLCDDLNLGGSFYPHPSARVIQGIDFIANTDWDLRHAESLRRLGWEKPKWADRAGQSEWYLPDATRLRFHHTWLGHDPTPLVTFFEKATVNQAGLSALSAPHQLYRTCRQGPEHLWMVDAAAMLESQPDLREFVPGCFGCLAWRWNQLFGQTTGTELGLAFPPRSDWNIAQWLLALSHRRTHAYGKFFEELSIELLNRGKSGRLAEWLDLVRNRWSLDRNREIPHAFLRRLRGDFS